MFEVSLFNITPVKRAPMWNTTTTIMTEKPALTPPHETNLCAGLELIRLFPAGLLGDTVVVVSPTVWGLELTPRTLHTMRMKLVS